MKELFNLSLFIILFFLNFLAFSKSTTTPPPPTTTKTSQVDAANQTNKIITTKRGARDIKCNQLLMGQFKCSTPVIDKLKQNEVNCTKYKQVEVSCFPADGIFCDSQLFNGSIVGFYRNVSCRYVTDYHYDTAVLLSIFFGLFGLDRIYLGYIGHGLLKFSTLGFMFIGYLFDLILIASQQLKPIDGSDYIVDYYRQFIKLPGFTKDTYNFTY